MVVIIQEDYASFELTRVLKQKGLSARKGRERQWRQAFVLRPPEGPSELERLRRLVQAYALRQS